MSTSLDLETKIITIIIIISEADIAKEGKGGRDGRTEGETYGEYRSWTVFCFLEKSLLKGEYTVK